MNDFTAILGLPPEQAQLSLEESTRGLALDTYITEVSKSFPKASHEDVRQDIAAQYQMYFAEATGQGALSLDAHETAMDNLGTIRRQRRQLDECYINRLDEMWLKKFAPSLVGLNTRVQVPLLGRLSALGTWVMIACLLGVQLKDWRIAFAIIVPAFFYLSVSQYYVQRLAAGGRLLEALRAYGKLVLVDSLGWIVVSILALNTVEGLFSSVLYAVLPLFIVVYPIYESTCYHRLARKL
ncbi:MAG: hypothetical protein GC168_11250 [Candidatus Hydrogenedens sp.]|nr:hypothetical protein [Candidatus Hydrogenedens sp.]